MAGLRARGHEVWPLSPYREPEVGRVGGSVAVGRLPRLLLLVPGYYRMLREGLRQTRASDAHVVSQYLVYTPATAVAFLLARLRGVPLFARAHQLFPGSYRSRTESATNRLPFRLYRRILRHPSTWFLVSSDAWRDLAVQSIGMPPDRVIVVPDCVALPPAPDPAAVEALRDAHGLRGMRVVLKFGSFTREGTSTFVEALRRVPRADVRGVVLADPEWGAAFRREAEVRGVSDRVLVLPTRPREEVRAFLALAEACVGLLSAHPMARGALPRSTLEAMAAGRPMVMCRDAVPTTLAEDRRTCLLVPPDDPDALAAAVARLLDEPDLARTLGDGARARVAEGFSPESVAIALESLLSAPPARASA